MYLLKGYAYIFFLYNNNFKLIILVPIAQIIAFLNVKLLSRFKSHLIIKFNV